MEEEIVKKIQLSALLFLFCLAPVTLKFDQGKRNWLEGSLEIIIEQSLNDLTEIVSHEKHALKILHSMVRKQVHLSQSRGMPQSPTAVCATLSTLID